ncbi:unnamed protein product, partial [Tetraodon nigroviridis]
WLYAVTGRCFGDRDFRGGLENGILLCELLSSIKPGLVKKINRLQTPIAGLVSPFASLLQTVMSSFFIFHIDSSASILLPSCYMSRFYFSLFDAEEGDFH